MSTHNWGDEDFDCYIEIKGWFRQKAKKKYNLFLKKYANINIKLFEQNKLKEIGIL